MNTKKHSAHILSKFKFLGSISASLLALLAQASAQTTTWQGTTSAWATSANWSNGAPVAGVTALFYDNSTTAFTLSGGATSRAVGGIEFLGSNAASFTISIGDGSANLRTLRIENNVVVDAGATGTFSILAADTAGTRTLNWGPGSGASGTYDHFITNNSTSATLVLGITQSQTTTTNPTVVNLNYGGAGNINVTAPIEVASSGSRTVNLIKNGNGTLTLTGANTYNGTTTISGGTLSIGNGGTSGSIANGSNITNNASLVFNRSDAYSYSGIISGNGSVSKSGAGTTTLTGENTYTGPTTISAGTLQIGNAGAAGSLVSNVEIQSAGTLTFAKTGITTYGGIFSGSGAINKFNSGTLILTNASTFTGTTTIQSTANNNIRLAHTNALAHSTINVGVTNGLRFDTAASTYTIGALSGGSNFALQDINADEITLRAGNNNADTTYSGVMSGNGNLDKVGSGTLILSGNNTYTGATTLTTGTLVVNGSLASSVVTVSSNGTLAGTGTLAGAVTINGQIAPGNSPGTLTINNSLTLNASANALMEIGGTGAGEFDQIALTGTLTLAGTISINLINGFNPLDGDSFALFTGWSGTIVDNGFSFDFSNANLDAGLYWNTSDFLSTGSISVTAVPEPATWALIGIGLGGLCLFKRLRGKQSKLS